MHYLGRDPHMKELNELILQQQMTFAVIVRVMNDMFGEHLGSM